MSTKQCKASSMSKAVGFYGWQKQKHTNNREEELCLWKTSMTEIVILKTSKGGEGDSHAS